VSTISLENPLMDFRFEIPTVRQSGVTKVVRPRFAPAERAKTASGTAGWSRDGQKLSFFEQPVAGYLGIHAAPVRIAQRLERVHAVPIVQIVPVHTQEK